MNFKIFPAHLNHEGQKVPLIKGWNELATNDPSQIKLWSELYKDKITFWGMPCGQVNGIYVLDIDVKKVNGWESLKQLNYQLPNTLRQDTPTGGSHFFFKTVPGLHYPNSVNQKLGLDTRGDRGWVAFYGFTNNEPLAECPDWLLKLPSGMQSEKSEAPKTTIRLAPEIAQGIFQASIDEIINAPPGESNDTLNRESFKVGQLVASESISRQFAEEELFKAAKLRGKPDYEARATIRSGLDGGLKHPLNSPFDNNPPIAAFEIPAAPGPPERWTPKRLTRSDLLNTSKLKKPQLFQDWSTEDIQLTTADGGTGKTTLKLYEAICLALGERFIGFDCKQPGKTLYITGEDTEGKLAAMIGAILTQMGAGLSVEENDQRFEKVIDSIIIKKDADLCLISKDKQGFLHPNLSAMEKILQAVDDIKPKMIVFDPIASFWGSEAALNDMNKAVTKFMSALTERSKACVEMINHMGKSSSSSKDMSQFAGRGGSGLPSNSRVVRVLMSLSNEEFLDLTGTELPENQSAMLCKISKFSDGSPFLNKPFIIMRQGFLFYRTPLSVAKTRELDKQLSDNERIFNFIKQERSKNKYPTVRVVVGYFMNNGDPMSEARIKRAITNIQYHGHMGEKIAEIDNPNITIKDKALIITDMDDREV